MSDDRLRERLLAAYRAAKAAGSGPGVARADIVLPPHRRHLRLVRDESEARRG